MSKKAIQMSERELVQTYKKGKEWLIKNEQIAKTEKNENGEDYDPVMYFRGLVRIEEIEDEMIKRGIKYGRGK